MWGHGFSSPVAWGDRNSPGEKLWPTEMRLDALREQMVLHGPTFAGLPQALGDFTRVSHPADPFIHSSAWPDPPSMCMAVGTHVPPHTSYASDQPTTPSAGALPILTSPPLNLGQKEDLKKVSAEGDVLLCRCRTLKPWGGDGDGSRLLAPHRIPSPQMGTAFPAAHA